MFGELEGTMRRDLNHAEQQARTVGAHMMLIGIPPTVTEEHLTRDSFSDNPRYELLNEQTIGARRGPRDLDRRDRMARDVRRHDRPRGRLHERSSTQLVEPEAVASFERGPGVAGAQVAVRRTLLLGKSFRREIADRQFEQRPGSSEEPAGSAAVVVAMLVTPIFEPRERALGAPGQTRPAWTRGETFPPTTRRSTAGTGRSTTCPGGQPHLRVENRLLPSGPTVVDICANAAFYYGLVRTLVAEEQPLWSRMSFSAAEENFHAGARDGIEAQLYWPGIGEVPASELILRRAAAGGRRGARPGGHRRADRDRLLGVIERRCVTMRNGAAWQSAAFHRLDQGDRLEALRQMTVLYREHMHANEPVHDWPLP